VELVQQGIGSTAPAALQSGSLQVATPTAPVFLQAVAAGIDLVVLSGGTVSLKKARGLAVLADPSAQIKVPSDFAGKKVAVPGIGAFLHVLFVDYLKKHGADPKQTTFIESPMFQFEKLLKARNVDAVIAAEPFTTIISRSGAAHPVTYVSEEAPDGIPVIFYAATREWVAEHKEAAKAFADAIAEASRFATENPEEFRKAASARLKISPEVSAAISLPDLRANFTPDSLKPWIALMKADGSLNADLNVDGLVVQW
jgi:NitT/TauT family transport system substrate-binding protein